MIGQSWRSISPLWEDKTKTVKKDCFIKNVFPSTFSKQSFSNYKEIFVKLKQKNFRVK